MDNAKETLEEYQVGFYFGAVVLAVLAALVVPDTSALEYGVINNPALAVMLFVAFLQVPLADLRRALARGRFLAALLTANFVAVPLPVAIFFPRALTTNVAASGA